MTILDDVRLAFRMLAKSPKFSAVVVLVLALGLGANATVFTLVNAVLFRGLPFEKPDQIVDLRTQRFSSGQNRRMGVSYPDFLDWKAQSTSFQELAADTMETTNVSDRSGVAERYLGASVSANFFALIGQKPLLGRDFVAGDGLPGAAPVVILSHGVWKTRYGLDPAILGRIVRVDDVPASVIGVMPEGMKFPLNNDLWTPLVPARRDLERDARKYNAIGRLKDRVTLAEARAEMEHIAKTLEKAYPKTNQGIGILVKPYNEAANGGPLRVIFLALLGAVGFVLMIACANVANLLLSRSLRRAREMAIRTALGASRWRVIRQLLVESVMLGLAGGALGLLLSWWGVRMFDSTVANVGKPYWIKFSMDYVVFGYVAAISIGTGLFFGLAPALQMSKVDVNEILKEGGRGTSGTSRARYLSAILVIGEFALALVLLAGAGLMIRSFLRVYGLDPGFSTNNILTMQFTLGEAKYPKLAGRVRFYEQLLPRLESIPGVESVAVASAVPLIGESDWRYELEGHPPIEREKSPAAEGLVVTPDYFRVLGVPLQRGHVFDNSDGVDGRLAVVVNQQFAARCWPRENAVGKRLRLIREEGERPWLTVVGVSPNILTNLFQQEPPAVIYVSYRQDAYASAVIVTRTGVPAATLAPAFRLAVQSLDGDLPLYDVATLQESITHRRWALPVFGSLFAFFAILAMVLSSIGIYAVVSYSVTRRTQEIGIRMALGASRGSILRLVLSAGVRQLAIGLGVGLGIALALTRLLGSVLIGVSPTDPFTFTAILTLLALVGLLACWLPARRATRVDPLVALRYE